MATTETKPPTYVAWHLGLGDAILCCGLMRELQKRHGHVTTFSKPRNLASVRFMFRDNPNIEVLEADDAGMFHRITDNWNMGEPLEVVGHHRLDRSIPFDRCFYQNAGVDFEKRWDAFYVDRDGIRRDPVQPGGSVFIHDDADRGMVISSNRILSDGPQLRPFRTGNIFDWLGMMEAASEIHVIPSAFMFICDSFPELGAKTTAHRYARQVPENEWPALRYIKKVLD